VAARWSRADALLIVLLQVCCLQHAHSRPDRL
jgi:hypothetical protein